MKIVNPIRSFSHDDGKSKENRKNNIIDLDSSDFPSNANASKLFFISQFSGFR